MRTLAKRPQDSAGELSSAPADDIGIAAPTNRAVAEPCVPDLLSPVFSRRSIIAALAASTAARVPAVGAAGQGEHPDAELLELGREYMALDRVIKAADTHYERCQAAYNACEPTPRDVMRHRIEDHVGGFNLPMSSSTRRLAAEPKHSAFYSEDEIDLLRERPPVEDPAEQARVDAILKEWDRWSEECADLSDEVGVTAALGAIEELVPRQRSLAKQIVAMPATTLAGLQVRALIVTAISGDKEPAGDDYTDQLMIRAIVRDLVKIAA
jgi:hypothetical protein